MAQVYLGLPALTGEPPKRLVGWTKLYLEPGKSQDVTVPIPRDRLAYWNVTANNWAIAPGEYTVYVGSSSRDVRLKGTLQFGQQAAAMK